MGKVRVVKTIAEGLLDLLGPGTEPVVTQLGRRGLPLRGAEQMAAAHPSKFGPFSVIKPRRPQAEVSVRRELTVPRSRKVVSPEILENATVVPLLGDRSIAGLSVKSINDVPVDVASLGGPLYGETNAALGSPAAWASEKAPIGLLRKKIAEAMDRGRDVYGVYTAMGPRAADQTTMMTDALLQQIAQADIGKRAMQSFDKEVRGFLPDFVGARDTGALAQLQAATQGTRKLFAEAMESAPRLKQGFPDLSASRIALTEDDLLDAPAGSSGFSVVKFGPESLTPHEVSLEHPTYPAQIAGEPLGQFEDMIPFDMLYRDFLNERRVRGAPAGQDLRSLDFSKPSSDIDAEAVDRIMRYLELVRKYE